MLLAQDVPSEGFVLWQAILSPQACCDNTIPGLLCDSFHQLWHALHLEDFKPLFFLSIFYLLEMLCLKTVLKISLYGC